MLDEASCHTARASRQLAAQLDITLLWLPKQCSELNSMDHLWRELKGKIAANRQFANIDAAALHAQKWVLGLTKTQAHVNRVSCQRTFGLKISANNFGYLLSSRSLSSRFDCHSFE